MNGHQLLYIVNNVALCTFDFLIPGAMSIKKNTEISLKPIHLINKIKLILLSWLETSVYGGKFHPDFDFYARYCVEL